MTNKEIATNYFTAKGEVVRYASERNPNTVEVGVGGRSVAFVIVENGAVLAVIYD